MTDSRNRIERSCPECQPSDNPAQPTLARRDFLRVTTAGVAAAAALGGQSLFADDQSTSSASKEAPETLVKKLYDTMNKDQRKEVCFPWDYKDDKLGLLRTRISNNWHITSPTIIGSDYYTKEQAEIVRAIYEGIISPEWHAKVDKQLKDDNGGKGWGTSQNIALFGEPGTGKFELVMTGRHMTLRCDGNSTEHMAFGGPIFYGHAASGFNEKPGHPGNVYWEQALEANKVYEMLDGKQRAKAEVSKSWPESQVQLQGDKGTFAGIPVADMTADQKEAMQKVLQKLIEPYRQSDRDEVLACLKTNGGLDKCSLAFFTDHDLGNDKVWDNWRLEGPAFVWNFRSVPHVHCWVNIADNADVKLNA
jgi:hypothetical protein